MICSWFVQSWIHASRNGCDFRWIGPSHSTFLVVSSHFIRLCQKCCAPDRIEKMLTFIDRFYFSVCYVTVISFQGGVVPKKLWRWRHTRSNMVSEKHQRGTKNCVRHACCNRSLGYCRSRWDAGEDVIGFGRWGRCIGAVLDPFRWVGLWILWQCQKTSRRSRTSPPAPNILSIIDPIDQKKRDVDDSSDCFCNDSGIASLSQRRLGYL
jgi:hypothetical protein